MTTGESTCWSVVRGAASGSAEDREAFVGRYLPVIRAGLAARWRATPHLPDLDDAVQEVFLDCFRPGGALERADPGGPAGFRGFLHGVIRNVALRFERKNARLRARPAAEPFEADEIPGDDEGLSVVFDREWAKSLLRQAGERQAELAAAAGAGAGRRVELLRLRFREGLPIRRIAAIWEADPARLHHVFARARPEFREALSEVVAFHHPGSPAETRREAARLLDLFG